MCYTRGVRLFRAPLVAVLSLVGLAACSAKQRNFSKISSNANSPDQTTERGETTERDDNAGLDASVGDSDEPSTEKTEDKTTTGAISSDAPTESTSPNGSISGPLETTGAASSDPAVPSGSERVTSDAPTSAPVTPSSDDVTSSPTTPSPYEGELVLHLSMDDGQWGNGEIYDASPAANHGVLNGTVAYTPDGKFGGAGHFDGNGYIRIPNAESLQATSALTLSAWVNFEYMGGDYSHGVISKRTGYAADTAYTLFLWAESRMWIDLDYETDRFGSATSFETNRWYHVAMVYDGSLAAAERVRLYVDGVLDVVTGESSASLPPFDCDLEVGRLVNGGNTMIGSIDEVAIWRRALSADDVAALAQGPLQ